MSYILDALKKSQAERHKGKVPEFGQQQHLILRNNEQRSHSLVIATILIFINLLAIVFWFTWQAGVFSDSSEELPVALLASTPEIENLDALDQPPLPASNPNADKAPLAELADVVFTASENTESPIQVSNITTGDRLESVASEEVDTQTDLLASEFSARTVETEVVDVKAVDAKVVEAVPHIDSLPDHLKRRIPDLTFNSHIYSPNESASRAMINNIYLRQGQYLSELKLESITEQGVIFSLDGQKFRVSVLSDWSFR